MSSSPRISIVIPARGGQSNLDETLKSLREGRVSADSVEVVIVDDASEPPLVVPPELRTAHDLRIRLVRAPQRLGVARARNRGVSLAAGEVIFLTDAHILVEKGWDAVLSDRVREGEILAIAVADRTSAFRGYGCRLVVPHMGTHWNREPCDGDVQIASAAATALHRSDFVRIGGYDGAMTYYGGAEPEFSLRAWLAGLRIQGCPELTITHTFKEQGDRDEFLAAHRTDLIHNSLRFGLLYLDRPLILAMLRLYAFEFPRHLAKAMRRLDQSDVWTRRTELSERLPRDFDWFVGHFDLHDQAGQPLVRPAAI